MNIAIDDFSIFFSGGGDVETNRVELIKQSTKIKQFGEGTLRNYPQRDVVASAFKLLQPEHLSSVLQNTANALQGSASQFQVAQDSNMPQLASEPYPLSSLSQTAQKVDKYDTSMTTSARMARLLSEISQLTGNVTLQKMVDQLKFCNAQLAHQLQVYGTLADQLEMGATQWAKDHDDLKQVQSLVGGIKQEFDAVTRTYMEAQKQLQLLQHQAENEVNNNRGISPELNKKIEESLHNVRKEYNKKELVWAQYNDAIKTKLKPAEETEMMSKAKLQNILHQAQSLFNTVSTKQVLIIENNRKQQNEEAKNLSYLLSVITQLINKSASANLQTGAELKKMLAEAAAKEAEKNAREFEVKQRDAEVLQKVFGCIGKILGWAVTIVSFSAAIFTGGASLALAAIGLALALSDEIYQSATGKSFIAEAFRPLMEEVIQPLIKLLAELISSGLQELGIPKEKADIAGNVLAGILLVVALIVVAVFASPYVGLLASKIGEKMAAMSIVQTSRMMLNNLMQKIINNTISQVLRRFFSNMVKRVSIEEVRSAKALNLINRASNKAQFANSVSHAAMNVTAAAYQLEADKVRARIEENIPLQQLLNTLTERLVDSFSKNIAAVNVIIENIAIVAENQMQAGKYITNKVKSVAV